MKKEAMPQTFGTNKFFILDVTQYFLGPFDEIAK
jgi:hypothetical protein